MFADSTVQYEKLTEEIVLVCFLINTVETHMHTVIIIFNELRTIDSLLL